MRPLGNAYCGLSANVTFSAISATLLAILAAMISNGEAPLTAAGILGVFLAAIEVAVPVTVAAFLKAGVGRLVTGAFATDGMM